MQTVKEEMHNTLIGFDGEYEFLPRNFDTFDSKKKLRHLFLYMSSIILKDCLCFNKYEQDFLSDYTLEQAFSYKIHKELNQNIFTKKQVKNFVFYFCKNSTILINDYLNQKKSEIIFTSKKYNVRIAKLISTCYKSSKLSLCIDRDLLFHEFVLDKLRKVHKNKEISDLGYAISMKSQNFHGIKIYTSWKNIKIDKPDIKEELKDAIKSIKKDEFHQIFLAYPKHYTFTKHIPVYVDELKNKEYQIKIIPYSLRSIIKN